MTDNFTAEEAMNIVSGIVEKHVDKLMKAPDAEIAALKQKVADLEAQLETVSIMGMDVPKAILPMLIAFSKKIHDESLSTWQESKRANGELLLSDMANSTFSADGNIKAEASENALKTATIAQNLSDKPLNIKPRGDSFLVAIESLPKVG